MAIEPFHRERLWKKSAWWGLLMFLVIGFEWLRTGKQPTVDIIVFVSVFVSMFIVGCMIAEATAWIAARLAEVQATQESMMQATQESVMRELLTLRQVGDTLLSRTAKLDQM
jgi:hypothetical protein